MKHLFSFLTLAFFVGVECVDAQAILQWAQNFGSDNLYATDEALNVATDAENNVYVTGYFTDSVDFDPGPGKAVYFFSSSSSHPAAFLAKYNPAGGLLWVIPAGTGSGGARGISVAFDSDGNVIWIGNVNGTIDLDPGPGNHSFGGSASYNSLFLAKYNSDGEYVYAFALSGIANCSAKQVMMDAADNFLVIGSFQGTIDFDPSSADFSLTAVNNSGDLFFARYATSGNFMFVKSINASPTNDNFDYGDFAAQDEEGNIYVTGKFEETTDFDPGVGVAELTATSTDVFFAQYDKDINLVWAKQLAGDDQAICHALAVDINKNIYLAGWFRTDIDLDPGTGISLVEAGNNNASDDIFFAKYSNAGELVWGHAMGGEGYDYATAIHVDGSGRVYLAGAFYREIDFNPGTGEALLSSPIDGQDAFLAVYDNNGNYLSASQLKGEAFSDNRAIGMDIDQAGDVVLTGWFSVTADFDCTNGVYSLTSGGDYDIYVAKYDSVIFSPVGIDEPGEIAFSVTPNPADDYFMIDVPINGLRADISVTDLTGRIALKILSNEIVGSGNQKLYVNTSSLIPSTYFIVFRNEDTIQTEKIIVQH